MRTHGLAEGLGVERLYPHRVRARISGLRRDLYVLDPESVYVSLDLSAMDEGVHEIVLSERSFHLPPDLAVTEVEPASVKVQVSAIAAAPHPDSKNPGGKRLTAPEAEALVRELPEVRRLTEEVKKRGFRPVLKVESGPNPLTQAGGRQVFSVFVGEDRVTNVVRLMTFEVNAASRELSVFDEEADENVPLAQWRKRP